MRHVGATVEVTCEDGTRTIKAYGESKRNGEYKVSVEGFDYGPTLKWACWAKIYAPKDSSCNIPIDPSDGTQLKVKPNKGEYVVVVKARPFAFATNKPHEECKQHHHPSPPPPPPPEPYSYYSPPPPSPTPYIYQSPPPPPPPTPYPHK